MSLISQAFVAETFGMRLTVEQMAKAMGLAKSTIYNQVAKKEFKIPTYMDGGQRYCDFRDMAAYLDECRGRAETPG